MKKILPILLIILFSVPLVLAEDCGITNLGSCIPQKIYEYFISLLNAPLVPLLDLVKNLLTEPVEVSLFASLWAVMVYIISMFYGLLFLYSGVKFIISGHDVAKRENAKEWFRNIFIMIILVQASYYLYSLTVDLGSLLTSSVVGLIDTHFFLLTADNLANIGLEFLFTVFYVITLMITALLLVLRYIVVACGVVFAPVGVFFYFIPPLKDYGKLIFNFLGICIFITFFDSIILLICSKVLEVNLFDNFKILIMITAFLLVNLAFYYFVLLSVIKSASKVSSETKTVFVQVGKYLE